MKQRSFELLIQKHNGIVAVLALAAELEHRDLTGDEVLSIVTPVKENK